MNTSRGTPAGIGLALVIVAALFGFFYFVHQRTLPYPWKEESKPASGGQHP